MVVRPERWRPRCPYLLLAVGLISLAVASPASARYVAHASGPGSDRAGALTAPAAPTLSSLTGHSPNCVALVAYPAPPTGEVTYLYRRLGTTGTLTQLVGPFTAAGSVTDAINPTAQSGGVRYYVVVALTADTLWTSHSVALVVATSC